MIVALVVTTTAGCTVHLRGNEDQLAELDAERRSSQAFRPAAGQAIQQLSERVTKLEQAKEQK